ncbi:MAG: hypothetical protein JWO56_678, partial [Acidobacteria bacterium]|nr:hypothetical protein [Acidobacteriota bacterium]
STQKIETPNPNPASRTEDAQAMLDRVEAWRKEIPTFSFPLPQGDRRVQSAARVVPHELLEQTVVAVKTIDVLARGNANPDELRDLVQYAVAFGPVADAIVRLAAEMQHSVDTARAKAGAHALVTFNLADRLSMLPGNEHLVPIVADMRRTLRTVPRFRGAKKAKKDTTTTPAGPGNPTPAAPPSGHPVN